MVAEHQPKIAGGQIERTALVQALGFLGLDANNIYTVYISHSGVWVQYAYDTASDFDDDHHAVYYRLV